MEKRIALESRGKTPSEVTELILDNCKATTIDGLTDAFTNLESLSLINVGLTSLRHFPKLLNLRKLDLSENRISGGLQHLKGCPKLASISLSNNRIKTIDTFEAIHDLKELRSLDLYQCEVTGLEDYREKMFQLLPQLQWLDGTNREGQAESESEDEEDDDEEGEAGEQEDESSGESSASEGDIEEEEDGEDEEEGEEEDEEDEEGEEEEEEEGPGLEYLQQSNLVDEDEEDFSPGNEEVEDSDSEQDEEDEEDLPPLPGGKAPENRRKRKRDDEDELESSENKKEK